MSKRTVTVATAVLVAGIGGYAVFLAAKPQADTHPSSRDRPVWTEVVWPFPIDEWGGGWAFQCKAADCGIDIKLYLRPKIGFCNCQTGVADDEELDRVGARCESGFPPITPKFVRRKKSASWHSTGH